MPTGKFKTLINDVLTLGHPPGPDTQHNIAPNAAVTLNGQSSNRASLQPNDNITLSGGDPETTVAATR